MRPSAAPDSSHNAPRLADPGATCEGLPHVLVLGTGGTIASSGKSATQLHDYEVSATLDDILRAVPQIGDIAAVEGEQVLNVPSHDIDNAMLLQIARRVAAALAAPGVDGVVLTHGTDTLEETAYFLNLVVKSDKPVVVVGAMRPASALSADGPLNLYNAVKLAASPDARGKGVLVLLNDRIVAARHAMKGHTTATDAFRTHEHGTLGEIAAGVVRFFYSPTCRHTLATDFSIDGIERLPPVDIIYDHQGAGGHFYRAAIEAGARGIVLAATGNGSLSAWARAGAQEALKQGVRFVRASRVGHGVVTPLAEDDILHTIAANSLNPQKARMLLMLALTQTSDFRTIQGYFDTY